jgi:hypothetical protein
MSAQTVTRDVTPNAPVNSVTVIKNNVTDLL